jgi:mycothiol synthase
LLNSADTLILDSVRTLSNFLRRADRASRDSNDPVTYQPAKPEQVHPALRLVLGANGKLADEGAVVDFMQFAVHRGVNLEDLWVAERAGRAIWATLPIASPGRTLLLLAPSGRPRENEGEDIAGSLIDAVCGHLTTRGMLLAQVLLDSTDTAARQIYQNHSFQQVAELLYLQSEVRRTSPAPALPEGFDWLTYSPESHGAFATTIVQSYRDSLDCPGLNGMRHIEDVIAGHKASGVEFDPSWWLVLRERGNPLGVLLIARAHLDQTAELVYLGLSPEARGRGIADLVMRQALHLLAAGGISTLALAVDAQNAPALDLYYRHGLRRVGSKIALMRQLWQASTQT